MKGRFDVGSALRTIRNAVRKADPTKTLIAIGALLFIACSWAKLSAAPTTAPTTDPLCPAQPALANIPDVVILDQLSKTEKLFEPVPFNHKGHASMAQIGGNCTTCHHRTPDATAARTANSTTGAVAGPKNQADAARHPACRTCHEPHRTDLRQPGLKGAYHRQCLNCHREWTDANNCNVCHKPMGSNGVVAKVVTPDDIMGRMHPPLPEPQTRQFLAEVVPADGPNVLFRHKEHTARYGLSCASCHRDDACSRCHIANDKAPRKAPAPKTHLLDADWNVVHRDCSSCHRRQETRCIHCHYKPEQAPPEPFDHAVTGQLLDSDHAKLKCSDCHSTFTARINPGCGNSACHPNSKTAIAFPAARPGPVKLRPEDTEPPVKIVPVKKIPDGPPPQRADTGPSGPAAAGVAEAAGGAATR